jgi:hypothetical protein
MQHAGAAAGVLYDRVNDPASRVTVDDAMSKRS